MTRLFETAKEQLGSPPLLVHYYPEKPLVLSCDASPYDLGAVLPNSVEKVEQLIVFASRMLVNLTKRLLPSFLELNVFLIMCWRQVHNYLQP